MKSENSTRDYYALLGINRRATPEEIKMAYRARALKSHPDVSGRDSAGEMDALNLAYKTLSNPEKRAQYDFNNSPHESPLNRESEAYYEDLINSVRDDLNGSRQPPRHKPSKISHAVRYASAAAIGIALSESIFPEFNLTYGLCSDVFFAGLFALTFGRKYRKF